VLELKDGDVVVARIRGDGWVRMRPVDSAPGRNDTMTLPDKVMNFISTTYIEKRCNRDGDERAYIRGPRIRVHDIYILSDFHGKTPEASPPYSVGWNDVELRYYPLLSKMSLVCWCDSHPVKIPGSADAARGCLFDAPG
jgi:hypothetical protein